MKQRTLYGYSGRRASALSLLAAVFSIVYFASADTYAQAPNGESERASYVKKDVSPSIAAPAPVLKDYRKLTIGASADSLRELWGKPQMEYPDGFLYEMSESESIQIAIGPKKEITAISVTFREGKGAPSFAEVFGSAAAPERRENGSVYRMVRYPDAGYWVAYYAGPPANPIVTLTMQKL